ncbi:hypothetical protein QOT17_012254 [Balamuthia mandrillaris]
MWPRTLRNRHQPAATAAVRSWKTAGGSWRSLASTSFQEEWNVPVEQIEEATKAGEPSHHAVFSRWLMRQPFGYGSLFRPSHPYLQQPITETHESEQELLFRTSFRGQRIPSEAVQVSVQGQNLTISVQPPLEKVEEQAAAASAGVAEDVKQPTKDTRGFTHKFQLPPECDPQKARAMLHEGGLIVSVPKATEDQLPPDKTHGEP